MVYTITSDEGHKTENCIICDKSTKNTQLVLTIFKDVRIPPNLTGLKVSVEKYIKQKPEIAVAKKSVPAVEHQFGSIGLNLLVMELEKVRKENQALRERNKNLMEKAASVTASKEMIVNMMKILCKAVNNFFQDKFQHVVAEFINQDSEGNTQCKALIEGLKKLHLSYSHREEKRSELTNLAVNLVLSDGEAVRFTTNKFNNIGIAELERFLSKKVKSVSAPQLMGGGYREMKIMNGHVNCPTLGWGDGQYKVVTEARPGKYQPRHHQPCCNHNLVNISVHLGQGYASRPGQRLGGVWGPRSRR